MVKVKRTTLVALAVTVLFSATAFAQDSASIAGSVADTTGAVLPGVTVVASSPALIEGSRTVVTDGAGAYRIVSLRPGIYTVTFTLIGFSTVVNEGIELQGSFAATVNAELAVGSVEETVTVTGATPIIDLQQNRQQEVFNSDVLAAIPTGRRLQDLALLVPGVTSTSPGAVAGSNLLVPDQMQVHGSDTNDYRTLQDGFILGNAYQSYTGFVPNLGSSAESTINTGGAGADWWGSGIVMNVIPKEGGNSYTGDAFFTGATSGWQSDNFSDRTADRGLTAPNTLKDTFDFNPSFGGPIAEDKLWFYASARWNQFRQNSGGTFFNKNAGDPNNFFYEPDLDRQAFSDNHSYSGNVRFTYQATRRNKIGISYDYQRSCACSATGIGSPSWSNSFLTTPEAAVDATYPDTWGAAGTWTSPLNNSLLLEVGFMLRNEKNGASGPRPSSDDPVHDLIPVFDLGSNFAYNGKVPTVSSIYSFFSMVTPQVRASLSYVTGSHSFKFGFTHLYARTNRFDTDNNTNTRYWTFTGLGPLFGLPANYPVPVALTQSAAPYPENVRQSESGLYAQDVWTIDRLTLNLGVRFDRYTTMHPSMVFGPGPLTPDRNFTTPDIDHFNQKDITPRFSAVYDLVGDGRTAVKVSVNKYVQGHGVDIWDGNPAQLITRNPTRSWFDGNNNFVPDCDLTNPGQNFAGGDLCGPIPSDWGQPVFTPNTRFNPDTIAGWGNRGWNWEFSTGVQHELLPGVSLDVAYFRKVFGNLLATSNEALGIDQFDEYTLAAPLDPGLPDGGGYPVGPLLDPKPELVAAGIPISNFQTFADEFGDSFQHWNGVDVNLNARLENGLLLAGGFSTGRASSDNCDVVRNTGPGNLVQTGTASSGDLASHLLYCAETGDFLTNIKGYGSYTIPGVDVQVSGTYQGLAGPAIEAEVQYSGAQIAQALGRPPLGGVTGLTEIQIVSPNTLFGERLHQFDFRFGKIFNYGRTRTSINLDLFNAFNSDAILIESATFSTFRDAQRIILGRIVKLSANFGF